MASLSATPDREDRDSAASIVPRPAPSPSATSKSVLLNPRNDPNELMNDSAEESDNEHLNDTLINLTPSHIRAIIQNDLIKRLSQLSADYFGRYLHLQLNSPFWTKLLNPADQNTNADGSTRPPLLISREWAEYVVDASRIFFDAGLSVDKVVSIIDRAICFAAICLLDRPTEKIYFGDGRNMFYEFESRGMPREMRPKYKAFLTGMRVTLLEGREEARSDSGMDVVQGSGEESEVVGEVEQLEDVVASSPADGAVKVTTGIQQETTDILRWEPSPTEVETSTLNSEAKGDSQDQTAKNHPLSKRERKKLKRKERKKRARAQAKLLSQSKDTMEVKVKEELRVNQNQKQKEKTKKVNAAIGHGTGLLS
ncbi:uncharacterized protein BHQ10_003044 [Talaromyces amestolkiae]|uniref:Uncharacterized protein n=1 Tax=Talaromyces amestolkiae TaxID=1196081 RepID=A0A364KU02_TALAM|nr:uncharacterized protein BHQ10_003044 [Talaromyces amestolkiae]RAO67032.1 hypothetical protein BHQ10_003044 [Talaromyces amestolkiae]